MLPSCQLFGTLAALWNVNLPSAYTIAPAHVLCSAMPASFTKIAPPYVLFFGLHPSGIGVLQVVMPLNLKDQTATTNFPHRESLTNWPASALYISLSSVRDTECRYRQIANIRRAPSPCGSPTMRRVIL